VSPTAGGRGGGPSAHDRQQPGIYFRSGERPPPCWRLVLLDFEPGTRRRDARDALASIVRMLGALRAGRVRELRGAPAGERGATADTFADLAALIGFGRRLFDDERHEPRLTRAPRPDFLAYLPAAGDPFPELPWAERRAPAAEADVALQLTASVQAATNRAAVEVWKLIEDEGLPLRVTASFDGFGRPDGRGWLEFHDGVGNLASRTRPAAITAGGDPGWMAGGTYMAFLRFRVDLTVWRALERSDQELVVGRDKLTGSPLVGVRRDAGGRARPVAGPPPPSDPSPAQRAAFGDPPETTDALVESSHVHRANQNRASPDAPAALRIYRQGYDFLESIGPEGPALGLNFVSFQADLATLQHLLNLPGWLGDVTFGGPAAPAAGEPPSPRLLSLLAGGLYAVPPRARPFPGAALLD
jgi:Dyp-type peroxidase family